MTAARKVELVWAPGELGASLVAPAVSTDGTREYLNKPWGQVMNGRGYIVGCDGHRLLAAPSAAWHEYKRDNAPPAEQVVPWDDARLLGEINFQQLDDARAFPAKWEVKVSVQPKTMLAHVRVPRGKKADLRPFGFEGVAVNWFKLDALTFTFGMNLPYLLDAVDFVGTSIVQVWGSEELAPFAFASPKAKTLREADRIAVVMPMRI